MLFRKDISSIFSRLNTLKGLVGEITLSKEKPKKVTKFVNEIKNIENSIISLPDGNIVKNEIKERLKNINRELLEEAVERIKSNTTNLWFDLLLASEKEDKKIVAEIRMKSLLKIKDELDLLKIMDLLILIILK